MTPADRTDWISRRIRLAVGQRLLLGLAPALLAIVLVLALAYYGEIGREAPGYVVAVAGILAALSLVLTWWNTRYLVRRLRRMGRNGGRSGDSRVGTGESADDDLDRIEGTVARLTESLQRERGERAPLEQRLREQATMLSATVRGVAAQVDDVRLPLHILLESRFGDLNENQEELLGAARASADEIDASLRRLASIADADRGAMSPRLEPVSLNDTMRAVLPMVRASADRRGVRVTLNLEPAVPSVWANRSAIAEAIALLVTRAAEARESGETLTVETTAERTHCALRIHPMNLDVSTDPLTIVAERVLRAQHAQISVEGEVTTVLLPRTNTPAAPTTLA